MNWEAIGAFAELGGALAVIATLFYIGTQVRENARAVRGQTFDSIIGGLNDSSMHYMNDAELFEISYKVFEKLELTDVEVNRFASWLLMLLRLVESAHHQCQLGLLEEAKLKPLVSNMGALFSTQQGQNLWETRRHLYDVEFRVFFENLIAEADSEAIFAGYMSNQA